MQDQLNSTATIWAIDRLNETMERIALALEESNELTKKIMER